jgi:hypothetical protein
VTAIVAVAVATPPVVDVAEAPPVAAAWNAAKSLPGLTANTMPC